MRGQFISFETAKLAREKGFKINVPCFYTKYGYFVYGENNTSFNPNLNEGRFSAPTRSILQKWLREVHKMHMHTYPLKNGQWDGIIFFLDQPLKNNNGFKNLMNLSFSKPPYYYNTHEKMLERLLQEALKII